MNGCLRLVGLAVVLHRSRRRGCIISHHRRGSHDRIYESPCSATLCGWMRTVGLSLAVLSARAPLAAELCGGGFVIAADALPLVVCGERGQCVLLITHILLLLYLFVLGPWWICWVRYAYNCTCSCFVWIVGGSPFGCPFVRRPVSCLRRYAPNRARPTKPLGSCCCCCCC